MISICDLLIRLVFKHVPFCAYFGFDYVLMNLHLLLSFVPSLFYFLLSTIILDPLFTSTWLSWFNYIFKLKKMNLYLWIFFNERRGRKRRWVVIVAGDSVVWSFQEKRKSTRKWKIDFFFKKLFSSVLNAQQKWIEKLQRKYTLFFSFPFFLILISFSFLIAALIYHSCALFLFI